MRCCWAQLLNTCSCILQWSFLTPYLGIASYAKRIMIWTLNLQREIYLRLDWQDCHNQFQCQFQCFASILLDPKHALVCQILPWQELWSLLNDITPQCYKLTFEKVYSSIASGQGVVSLHFWDPITQIQNYWQPNPRSSLSCFWPDDPYNLNEWQINLILKLYKNCMLGNDSKSYSYITWNRIKFGLDFLSIPVVLVVAISRPDLVVLQTTIIYLYTI